MNNKAINFSPTVENRPLRSPLSLLFYEPILAVTAGAATWYGINTYLWSLSSSHAFNGEILPAEAQTLQGIIDSYAIPLGIMVGISKIFLLRVLFNQERRYFSRKIHLAIAFPVAQLVIANLSLAAKFQFSDLLCIANLIFLPAGLVFSLLGLASITQSLTKREETRWGWITAIVWNSVFFVVSAGYFLDWFSLFGD